jgi:DNA processing protein
MSSVLFSDSPLYPAALKTLKGMPRKLFFEGEWPKNLGSRSLGIVGSRRVSPHGIRVLRELFYHLRGSDAVIISGFTVGVDSYAHNFALDAGCKTVAVMPCGADIVHPLENKILYQRIIGEGSLILSEYENGFLPKRWTYPKRNRIIAALSQTLLVVEASMHSGSMITAHFSFKYGKKVCAVPGEIFNERSAGTNKLISEGALIYRSPLDIVNNSDCTTSPGLFHNEPSNMKENLVLTAIREGNADFDKLSLYTGFSFVELNSLLLRMIVKNLIEEKGGIYYVL